MNIIETKWKWRNALATRPKTSYIALHHAAAKTCTAAQVDEWHKANKWSGIGYHFFVRKDGSIYRGRPLDSVGAHVSGMNTCSVGICAEGDYDKEKEMPVAQKNAIKELLRYLKGIYPAAKIVGHREIGESDCPGQFYPIFEMKNHYNNVEEEIDMEKLKELESQMAELKKTIQAKDDIINRMGEEIDELKAADKQPMIYNYIDDNMPEWAKEGVQYCLDHGIIQGTGDGELGLDDKDLKYCTMIMRAMEVK